MTGNVRDYGALGNGQSDDTDAVAKAINSAIMSPRRADGSPLGTRTVYFPGGTYRVARTFKINAGQISFVGEGKGQSIVEQVKPNIPAFLWDASVTDGWFHSVRFAHMMIRNVNPPTSATPDQWGIRFQAGDGSLIEGSGLHHSTFDNLAVENMYVGIGTYRTTGSYPIWSTTFRDCWFRNTKHTAIKLDSPIGQPANRIEHCSITNNDPTIVADGPAISSMGGLGLTISDLNVEDWSDTILVIGGGGVVRLSGLRSERHTFRTPGAIAYYLSRSIFDVGQVDFDSYRAQHKGTAYVLRVTDKAVCNLRGVNVTKDVEHSTPNNLTVFLSDEVGSTLAWGVRLDANTPLRAPVSYRAEG